MQAPSLGWGDPLEEGRVTHSSILAWRIPTDRGAWQVILCSHHFTGVGKEPFLASIPFCILSVPQRGVQNSWGPDGWWWLPVTQSSLPQTTWHLDPDHAHLACEKAEAFSKEFPTKTDTLVELSNLTCPSWLSPRHSTLSPSPWPVPPGRTLALTSKAAPPFIRDPSESRPWFLNINVPAV